MEITKGDTVSSRLLYWANTEPASPAFIFWGKDGRHVLSRAEVLDLSSRFAHRLSLRGVNAGDVVCVALQNSPEKVVVDFGIQLAGAVPMNCQILRTDGQDLMESLQKSRCKVFVVDPDARHGPLEIFRQHCKVEETEKNFVKISNSLLTDLSFVEYCRCTKPTMQFLNSLKDEKTLINPGNSSGPGYIFTTSGSSGYTKLALHSTANLMLIGKHFAKLTETTHGQKYCACAPLGWIGGYPFNYLETGCSRVLIDDTRGEIPDRLKFLWQMLNEESVTVATLMPIHYMSLYGLPEIWKPLNFKLKKLISPGQATKRTYLEVVGKLTENMTVLYGATEIGLVSSLEVNANNAEEFEDNMVGFPPEGTELRVCNENNVDVPAGSRGNILIRAFTLCKGYVDHKSTSFLSDGWFQTDDVGYFTSSGCLILEGRASDAIMHGGYILFPYWLEKKLANYPGVKEVLIVPVPDSTQGQEICACIRPNDNATICQEDIINFCKAEMDVNIPEGMKFIPKYVLTFDSFHLTKTFKIDRKETAVIARKRLGL